MIKEEIKRRIENLQSDALFYLVDYTTENDDYVDIFEVLGLEDGVKEIDIDRNTLVISDKDGNILKEFKDRGNNEDQLFHFRYSIDLVNGTKIVISEKNVIPRLAGGSVKIIKKTTEYKLGEKLNTVRKFETTSGDVIEEISIPSKDDEILLIKGCQNRKKYAYLYSVRFDEEITPRFTELEQIEGRKAFIFKDIIESKDKIDGRKEKSLIS